MKKEDGIIIVVDNDVVIGDGLGEYLETLKLQVFVFADPKKAFDFMVRTEEEVALLITDYNMPGVNGEELAAEAKILIPGIKIICISGNENIPKSFEFDGFLEKPLYCSQLGEMVTTLLEN